MSDLMTFPDTVEEFMERYKVIDTMQVYTNGAELVPIFRMKQWFEHLLTAEPRTGKWVLMSDCTGKYYACSWCGHDGYSGMHYCPNCGARMKEENE